MNTETDPRAMDLGDTGAPQRQIVSKSGLKAELYDHESAALGTLRASDRVEKLIDLALRGALPRTRALKSYEPDKLNSRHVGCVLLRAAGYRNNRICELMGYEPAVVSVILNHPDSRTILAAVLAEGARQAIDITATIKQHAPAMLDIVRDIAQPRIGEVKPETQLKAAFGWLGMYERLQEKHDGAGEAVQMASADAQRLADAIRESAGLLPAAGMAIVVEAPGGGSGSSQPSEARPSFDSGALPPGAAEPFPSDLASQLGSVGPVDSLVLTEDQMRALLDDRAAELESQLEQRLQVLETDPAQPLQFSVAPPNPLFPSPAGVRIGREVSNSDVEEVA